MNVNRPKCNDNIESMSICFITRYEDLYIRGMACSI